MNKPQHNNHVTVNFRLPIADYEDDTATDVEYYPPPPSDPPPPASSSPPPPTAAEQASAHAEERLRMAHQEEITLYSLCQRIFNLFRRAFGRRNDGDNDDVEVTYVRNKPDRIDSLCKNTKFTKNELKFIYQGFKQACPTGIVNESTFKDVYAQFFPQGDSSQYAHYVFKAFDHDRSGTINFQEFVLGLSTISRGSPREKLQWTFNLYDINGDGCITREEMHEVISSIYSLLGRFTHPTVSEGVTRDHADRVFDRLDQNRDGKVTFDEFLEICLQDDNITQSLSLLDTVL